MENVDVANGQNKKLFSCHMYCHVRTKKKTKTKTYSLFPSPFLSLLASLCSIPSCRVGIHPMDWDQVQYPSIAHNAITMNGWDW